MSQIHGSKPYQNMEQETISRSCWFAVSPGEGGAVRSYRELLKQFCITLYINIPANYSFLKGVTPFSEFSKYKKISYSFFENSDDVHLREYCSSYIKLACFVLYLKIINTLKNKICIIVNCSRNSKLALKF